MIIGFSGAKQHGKDTAAQPLIEQGFVKLSFAKPVKDICSRVFQFPYETFDDPALKDTKFIIPVTVDASDMTELQYELMEYQHISHDSMIQIGKALYGKTFYTPREILQFIGTDVVRAFVDDNFWINAFSRDVYRHKNVVVTDVRFPNERETLRKLGATLVKVERPGWSKSEHISDNLMGENSDYDAVFINDSTIEALHHQSGALLDKSKI